MKADFVRGIKICSKCKQELPLDAFYKKKASNDGLFICCKECWNKRCEIYNKTNDHKKAQKKYENSVKGKSTRKNFNANSMEYRKQWFYDKRAKDPSFKLLSNLRTRCNHMLKGEIKHSSILRYFGCSVSELRQYIEQQFKEGMNWNNFGDWHIDHIIPVSYFDFKEEKDFYIAWNYRNLQPLWAKDNLEKSNKVPDNIEKLLNNLIKEIYDNN